MDIQTLLSIITPFVITFLTSLIYIGRLLNKIRALEQSVKGCQDKKCCIDSNGQTLFVSKKEHNEDTKERVIDLIQRIDKSEQITIDLYESQKQRIVNLEKKIDKEFSEILRSLGKLEGKMENIVK